MQSFQMQGSRSAMSMIYIIYARRCLLLSKGIKIMMVMCPSNNKTLKAIPGYSKGHYGSTPLFDVDWGSLSRHNHYYKGTI